MFFEAADFSMCVCPSCMLHTRECSSSVISQSRIVNDCLHCLDQRSRPLRVACHRILGREVHPSVSTSLFPWFFHCFLDGAQWQSFVLCEALRGILPVFVSGVWVPKVMAVPWPGAKQEHTICGQGKGIARNENMRIDTTFQGRTV